MWAFVYNYIGGGDVLPHKPRDTTQTKAHTTHNKPPPNLLYITYCKMKQQTTRKHARTLGLLGINGAENRLLKPFDATYYTAGTYGRNEDIFYIAGQWFTVGYRTTAEERIPYDIAKKYDEMAREFYQKNYNREERRAYCRDLVEQMLTEYENATK